MRLHRRLLLAPGLALLLACTPALATPPGEALVQELLEVTDARKMMEQMLPAVMQQSQQMAMQALPADASDEDRAKLEQMMQAHHRALVRAFSWERLQPVYQRVYGEVFTAREVQAMIDFYRSPEGASAMAKMPQAVQLSMVQMQPIMLELMQAFEQELGTAFGN